MSSRGEVLVAIVNNQRDFEIAWEQRWYRIPVDSAHKFLKNRWPPQWLAFYQTKDFMGEAYAVNYYAPVLETREASREQLFPDEPPGSKSGKRYYQLLLQSLQKLPQPILSRRWRRIVFIPTTTEKFFKAVEINDLYDGSPLDDRLWAELKRQRIWAERQEDVKVNSRNYKLDFAIYCCKGKVNVETDGDTYHADPKKTMADNLRNNDLASVGWQILRFSTRHIQAEMLEYCTPIINRTVEYLGGLDEDHFIPRKTILKTHTEKIPVPIHCSPL